MQHRISVCTLRLQVTACVVFSAPTIPILLKKTRLGDKLLAPGGSLPTLYSSFLSRFPLQRSVQACLLDCLHIVFKFAGNNVCSLQLNARAKLQQF